MARRSLLKEVELIRNKLGDHAIVLVGLMGAGKTTVGRRLSDKLGIPFVDADHEIEIAAGKRIAEIFADHGEAYFREGERKVIARLLESGAQVMATGGGAFMNEETRRRIREAGVSVWLRADLALLLKRVSRRSDRPLLNNDDPAVVMTRLVEQRYPVYATADITVDSRDIPHTSIVSDVIKALAEWPEWERLGHAQR
jgi:shikimate kinase